ncbi:chaperone DnaJ protein [Trypanosoma theileri]|uniref:Chaperone DnaJ protein n=1 Tax=Trypanosoma theileri TaxID=67003 RepID=A0A1X0P737_9TRYP|nr:chaperone DnaJ protein [Trypanosoma theileri]ORC92744.1 chaperone DnaJ protein [Trypanosoma theileri]
MTPLSPYDILEVPSSASIAEIRAAFKRLALLTHPDKIHNVNQLGDNMILLREPQPFHVIKEASEILMDPLRRAQYDHGQQQSYVRSVGVVSDTYDLSEFDLKDERILCRSDEKENNVVIIRVYALECRCGGSFELFLTQQESEMQEIEKLCECDCCSLVISVTWKGNSK